MRHCALVRTRVRILEDLLTMLLQVELGSLALVPAFVLVECPDHITHTHTHTHTHTSLAVGLAVFCGSVHFK